MSSCTASVVVVLILVVIVLFHVYRSILTTNRLDRHKIYRINLLRFMECLPKIARCIFLCCKHRWILLSQCCTSIHPLWHAKVVYLLLDIPVAQYSILYRQAPRNYAQAKRICCMNYYFSERNIFASLRKWNLFGKVNVQLEIFDLIPGM